MSRSARLVASLRAPLAPALHALLVVGVAFGNLAYLSACANSSSAPAPASAQASEAGLVELVEPIALYPDELLAIVLPAATFPLQVVQAARLLGRLDDEPDLKPDEDWDESIIGILNYPEVVQLLNDDLNWTWRLGEAVVADQTSVLDAIQSFRARVDRAGNLQSNDEMRVTHESPEPGELEVPAGESEPQIIVIESASSEVIFVPVYQPTTVVVRHVRPYRWWWSRPYPLYFHPHAVFWTGMFVGSAVGWGLSWGWGPRWHHHHRSTLTVNRNIDVNVDRPTRPSTPNRPGNRPGDRLGGGRWQPDRGPGRPGGGERPVAGRRPSVGAGEARPAVGGQRPSTGERGAQQPAARGSFSGRYLTSQRGQPASSMGSYNRGSTTRAASWRASASRSAAARDARSGGGARGAGGRGAAGGRR